MRKKGILFFGALLLLGIAACDRAGGDLEAQIDKLKKSIKKPIGYSPDYFLCKDGKPVILVFGYGNDFSVCTELIREYLEKHPQDKGRFDCRVANEEN